LLAILQAAGWPIWPLLIASIVALALIIERLIYLRREKILPKQLLGEVIQVYRNKKATPEIIGTLEQNSPLGTVLAAALRNVDAPRDVMKESIEEAGRGVAHVLERFLTTLGTIASLAPLMGLFGTVVGMIEIFGAQNASGANPAHVLTLIGRPSGPSAKKKPCCASSKWTRTWFWKLPAAHRDSSHSTPHRQPRSCRNSWSAAIW